jgi:3-hydroxybutyryl-CoA dehydrogenase
MGLPRAVAVIGAGTMGNGIAQVFAASGSKAFLVDVQEDLVRRGVGAIEQSLGRFVKKEKLTKAQADEILGRVVGTASQDCFAECDLIIEAVTENVGVKQKVFAAADERAKPECIIASNTSSISITVLGAATKRPDKVVGMHFMNPVPLMKLVEVIRGLATDQQTYDAAVHIVERVGKHVTNAEDFPAFIVNRVLMPMINEAVYTLYEGVGTVESIDTAMKLGANHPMGPLELADFIGLDTCLSIMQVLYEGLADSKYRPCPLLVKYVEAGWLGRKANRGFYDYRGEKPVPTR